MKMKRGLLSALLALSVVGTSQAQGDPWNDLWTNHLTQARGAFAARLSHDPGDCEAARGLAWADSMEGDDGQLAHWRSALGRGVAPEQVAVWSLYSELCRERGRYQQLSQTDTELAPISPVFRANLRASHTAMLDEGMGPRTPLAGFVGNWTVLGPLSNVSGSGVGKSFLPEAGYQSDTVLQSQAGGELRWHPMRFASFEGGICPSGLTLGDDEVYYQATSVKPARVGKARVMLDVAGAFQLWVNGRQVLRSDVYAKNAGLDLSYSAEVELGATNQFMLKTASRSGPPRVTLVLTDASGRPLESQSDPSGLTPIRLDVSTEPEADNFVVGGLRESKAPDRELWLAREELQEGRAGAAVVRLSKLLEAHPDSALVEWQLSHACAVNAEAEEARRWRRAALKNFPELYPAQLAQARDMSPGPGQLEAVKELVRKHPHAADALEVLALAQLRAGRTSEAEQTVKTLSDVDLTPAGAEFCANIFIAEGNSAGADELVDRVAKRFPLNAASLDLRVARLVRQGRLEEAMALGKERVAAYPSADNWRSLAKIARSRKDPSEQIRCLREARVYSPQSGPLALELAEAYRASGQPATAMELYRETLRLDPGEVAVRDKIREASGQKPVLDSLLPAVKLDFVSEPARPKHGAATVLLDESRTVLYPDMAYVRVARLVLQVNTEAAARSMGVRYAPRLNRRDHCTLEVARVLGADGQIKDVRGQSGGGMASFPALQAGDRYELIWRVEGVAQGTLAHDFWDQWCYDFPGAEVEKSHYALACPGSLNLQVRRVGKVSPPSEQVVGDWKVREWSAAQVSAPEVFALSFPRVDRSPRVELSTINSWKRLVDWYRDLSDPLCKPDEVVRAKALELTRGQTDELGKIQVLQKYVADKLRYQTTPFRNSAFIPTTGKEVLSEGYGDCKDKAALLCAMLDTVGIPAHIVLVSTRSNGMIAPVPSPWFNHAIVLIESKSGRFFVDGTVIQPDLARPPLEDQGTQALVIENGVEALTTIPIPAGPENRVLTSLRATLSADGSLAGNLTFSTRGTTGDLLRSILKRIPPDKMKDVGQAVVAGLFPGGAQSTGCKFIGLDDPATPFRLEIALRVKEYGRVVQELMVASSLMGTNPLGGSLLTDIGRAKDQELDILSLRGPQTVDVRLDVPPGYGPAPMRSYHLTNDVGSLKTHFSFAGRRLSYHLVMDIKADRVKAGQGRELLALLKGLNQAQGQGLMLRKKHV